MQYKFYESEIETTQWVPSSQNFTFDSYWKSEKVVCVYKCDDLYHIALKPTVNALSWAIK